VNGKADFSYVATDPVTVAIFSHRELIVTEDGGAVSVNVGNRTYVMTVPVFQRIAEKWAETAAEL
jgi:CTP synthase (UTP-ammonia lyase)